MSLPKRVDVPAQVQAPAGGGAFGVAVGVAHGFKAELAQDAGQLDMTPFTLVADLGGQVGQFAVRLNAAGGRVTAEGFTPWSTSFPGLSRATAKEVSPEKGVQRAWTLR